MSIVETIKQNRPNISNSSLNTYQSILRALYRKIKDVNKLPEDSVIIEYFKNNAKDVIDNLKDIESSKRKTILSALSVLTLVGSYKTKMNEDIEVYNEKEKEMKLTDKQKENWMDWPDILKVQSELLKIKKPLFTKKSLNFTNSAGIEKNLTNDELQDLQDAVLLSIYTLQPPRRAEDYTLMKIKNIDKEKDNYIMLKPPVFVFNKFKNTKYMDGEAQKVEIYPEFLTLLKKWLKINPYEFLFFDKNGNQLNQTQITHRLNRILGKKISVNMLRHSFLTDLYANGITADEIKRVSNAVGHNVARTLKYVKDVD